MLTTYEVTFSSGVKQIWDVMDESLSSFMQRLFGYPSILEADLKITRIEPLQENDNGKL